MPFRGWFAVNGIEFANSSRVAAHLGHETPTTDVGVFEDIEQPDCSLTMVRDGLYAVPESSFEVRPGLWSPPNGARRYGPGLAQVGQCWGPIQTCEQCETIISYDDTWTGLQAFLGDPVYRVELAPWYQVDVPQSGEFVGVWVMDVMGLETVPVERQISQLVGHGAVAGPHRDNSRTITFDALLIGCTNAGLKYGMSWLTCILRETIKDSSAVLTYLSAHPEHSVVDPASLVREAHGLVLTQSPNVTESINTGAKRNQQATVYRVTWEMEVLSPYAYLPEVTLPAVWDEIAVKPVTWIHAADCVLPESCEDMPVYLSEECTPEVIDAVATPPPVCGGCLPVGEIVQYRYQVQTQDYPYGCRETAVTTIIHNRGERRLTLQGFWRVCGTDVRCEDHQFPLQVAAMPPASTLTLDGITGRFWLDYDDRKRRPVGVVGTPNGAPWRPPLVDRHVCWDFLVQTDAHADFEVEFVLADREP